MELPENSLEILHIPEPDLEFGHGQFCDHPKDGLFLYGPHEGQPATQQISVGIIGTEQGIAHFHTWAAKASTLVPIPERGKRDKEHRLHLSDFPGLEEAFGLAIDPRIVARTIDGKELDERTRTLNHHEAVKTAVGLYVAEIEAHGKNEEQKVDVWVLILPELVFERCKPESKRTGLGLLKGSFGKRQTTRSDLPLLAGVLDQTEEAVFDDIPDFHRQVKAQLLKVGVPSQLVRETTLSPDSFKNKAGYNTRRLQDPASVAWNLATGLYYKTQPKPPWKLAHVRPGVCYIGLVFKLIPNHPRQHACCAAQMFLSEGDGVVFRGANGPYRTAEREFHLKTTEAKNLIAMVLKTYKDKHGSPPKELFIHGRTRFNDEEWEAFKEAAPEGTTIIGVRITTTGGEVKLFRDGDYPALRGTAMVLSETSAYLWTSGFLPRLDTYIGPETPNPLHISIQRSTGDMPELKTVLGDIMGLTKINYNACNYSDGLPVTIRFADKVGDILVMGSAKDADRQPFKFYI
jgi:hypothetical protein